MDNRYVLKKLKALLLAVLKKDWYRLPSEDEVKDDVSGINATREWFARRRLKTCRRESRSHVLYIYIGAAQREIQHGIFSNNDRATSGGRARDNHRRQRTRY